jgi:penicillin-binding protein 1A
MFKRIRNPILRYLVIFIYFVIIFFCSIELNLFGIFGYSPDMKDIKSPTQSVSSEVFTADGKLLARFYKENRSPIKYKLPRMYASLNTMGLIITAFSAA